MPFRTVDENVSFPYRPSCMANSAQVVDRLAPMAGLSPVTVKQIVRALRGAGLVPRSGKGGGKGTVHYDPVHLSNTLTALAGSQPSAGPEFSRACRRSALVVGDSEGHVTAVAQVSGGTADKNVPAHSTFGTFLDSAVEYWRDRAGSMALSREAPETDLLVSDPDLEIDFCTNPTSIRVRSNRTVRFYTASGKLEPGLPLRRITTITLDLIKAAAELALDTQRHDLVTTDLLSKLREQQDLSGPGSTATSARNENAAPGRAAPRQPRTRTADGLTDPRHSTSPGGKKQSLARDPGPTGRVPTPRRSRYASSNDAAAQAHGAYG